MPGPSNEGQGVNSSLERCLAGANGGLSAKVAALELALFEERTRTAQLLARQRAECLADALAAARDVAAEVLNERPAAGWGAADRSVPEATFLPQMSTGFHSVRSYDALVRRRPREAADAPQPHPGPPPPPSSQAATLSEKIERAQSVGLGVLYRAQQVRSHFGDVLGGDGAALKETLLAIAHPYGDVPPISPAEALPAALACIDFAIVALPALLDHDASRPAGQPGDEFDAGVIRRLGAKAGAALMSSSLMNLLSDFDEEPPAPESRRRVPTLQLADDAADAPS